MNQMTAVLNHLQKRGSITSMEAIRLYGTTRLADKILKLRQRGYNIKTVECIGKTRFGDTCRYAKYVLENSNE